MAPLLTFSIWLVALLGAQDLLFRYLDIKPSIHQAQKSCLSTLDGAEQRNRFSCIFQRGKKASRVDSAQSLFSNQAPWDLRKQSRRRVQWIQSRMERAPNSKKCNIGARGSKAAGGGAGFFHFTAAISEKVLRVFLGHFSYFIKSFLPRRRWKDLNKLWTGPAASCVYVCSYLEAGGKRPKVFPFIAISFFTWYKLRCLSKHFLFPAGGHLHVGFIHWGGGWLLWERQRTPITMCPCHVCRQQTPFALS
jgi:hypothetical protein